MHHAAVYVLLLTLLAASPSFAAGAQPHCTGAGLPPDAPLYYLMSKRIRVKNNVSYLPKLYAYERQPSRRQSAEQVLAKEDMGVFVVSLREGREQFSMSSQHVTFFIKTDLNDDCLTDLLEYIPEGGFYSIRLYAACGDNYFTPVGDFISREVPEARAGSEVNGARWAEYEVIAPDPPLKHDDPWENWARRTWKFDGIRYQQTAVEPLR